MRMFQSRLQILSALAAHGGELAANGEGYLPNEKQQAFFGCSKSKSAMAGQLGAMENDGMIAREMGPSRKRTVAIRLTDEGWRVVREHGWTMPAPTPVVLEIEPEPEPEPESEMVAAARALLDLALARDGELQQLDAVHERYAAMANALEKTLGEKRRVEIQLRDTLSELRMSERRERGLQVRIGRVERLLTEARAIPRDSELYHRKLEDLARLMEEKPQGVPVAV